MFDCEEAPLRQTAVLKVLLSLDDNDLVILNSHENEDDGASVNKDTAGSQISLESISIVTDQDDNHTSDLTLPVDLVSQLKERATPGVLKALGTADSKSRLPLHIACEKGASYKALKLLVALYPEACKTPPQSKQLLLDLYFEYLNAAVGMKKSKLPHTKAQASMELLIDYILSSYDELRKKKDQSWSGVLPLHIACELGLSFETISSL